MVFQFVKKKTSRPRNETKDGVFVKYGVCNLKNEVEKSNSLHEISTTTRLFSAPKIICFNEQEQSITFEYFRNLRSIREVYLNYMTSKNPDISDLALLSKTGAALAKIHEGLTLNVCVDWNPCPLFERVFRKKTNISIEDAMPSMDWSIAHCDYGFSNIHTALSSSGNRDLVIIDPSPNVFVTKQANLRAPVLLDLSNLVSCICGMVPLSNYKSMHWSRVLTVKQHIVKSYVDACRNYIDPVLLDGMVYATAKCYFNSAYKKPFSTMAYWLLFTPLKYKRQTRCEKQ
ncbi:MAG: hypothetical protein CMJ26_03135 [Phycisphaerae bacterium]|nr:hypothetical protein [Phycisphaerae bacterium]|tara:strand:- start:5452 stop:6312 length:861 start_codon:yes stop_codon:yes gene_type:complete